ncbi:MAG TPA: glycosyltransferase family 4 protein [Candidatus Limnocylindrales bacterium]|nr:glycosyltransferase family 4 protein [Candidatus Limnocylindrales bacterium]
MTRSDEARAPRHGGRRSRKQAGPRPVAILAHSYYLEDPRVRRQAEALAATGREVDVYALRNEGEAPEEMVAGVRILRLPVRRHQGAGLVTYFGEYLDFLVRAMLALAQRHPRRRYGLVQVATLPDYLVLAALPVRLAGGVPVLLDLHEAMPEFFRSRFPRLSSEPIHRLLGWVERASIGLADQVLTVNDALADRLRGLGVPARKVEVVLNAPDLRHFDPSAHQARQFMADGTLRLVYAGAVTPVYELDVAVDAVARLVYGAEGGQPLPFPVRLDVYGRGDSLEALRAQAAARGVGEQIVFHGRIPLEEVAERIAGSDVGLAPTRRDAFTDFSLSTKLFEYAVMGKVAIASHLPTVERYFGADAVLFYEPGDAPSMAAAVRRLADEPGLRQRLAERAAERVAALSWPAEAARYVALVDRLARG